MKRNILVIGGGAIGGVISARLTQKKYQVDLLVKYPSLKDIAKNEGLKVIGHLGEFSSKVNTFLPSDLLSETFDIVLIATKAPDLEEAALHILPFLGKDSLVVSRQNGICEDDLARIVGYKRTVGCVVGWGATMIKPGVYDMTSGGEFVIGTLDSIPVERMEYLKEILSNIVPVYITENIYGTLYSKLIVNSCISTLGGISGIIMGKMLKKRKIRKIFLEILREAMRVAEAMNLKVEPYANKIDYYEFTKEGFYNSLKHHLAIRLIGLKYRRLKSSALQSLERGKKTEIDWFNGYILKKAAEYKINVPVNEKLVEIINEIEAGKRSVGMHNLDDAFLRQF
jgi:2-dehydropantoate 2-reductase